MNIIIAGGSGFLGRALTAHLRARGDRVQVLTRSARHQDDVAWTEGDVSGKWVDVVANADAVVNLAGESIAKGRWMAARKQRLVESRITTTRSIVDALSRVRRNGVLLNASAIGIYGDRGSEPLTEASVAGSDFLATLCVEWEREAARAEPFRRVVRLRTGLVLDPSDGALAPLLTPFRLGVGGPLGTGRQYWSWIHRDDWVRLVTFAIDDVRVDGALNLTAPHPVTNRDFAKALGHALHRPAVMPVPAVVLRLLLGEMADAMVLGGQRVTPERALGLGYAFEFNTVERALADLFETRR